MKTIAILNLKGGTGKTVTTINVASILAARQKRVLVMDADSQCNATEFLRADSDHIGMADLVSGYDSNYNKYIQTTRTDGLDVVSAAPELMDLDLSKIETQCVRATSVADFVVDISSAGEVPLYDYVLIDCPPAFNAASVAALAAADEVIVPMKLDAFSLRGMGNVLRQVRNMKKINPRLVVSGILVTMWRNDPALVEAEKQLCKISTLHVYKTHIRNSAKVDGMTLAQEPLRVYSPNSGAGRDYKRFVDEYLSEVE